MGRKGRGTGGGEGRIRRQCSRAGAEGCEHNCLGLLEGTRNNGRQCGVARGTGCKQRAPGMAAEGGQERGGDGRARALGGGQQRLGVAEENRDGRQQGDEARVGRRRLHLRNVAEAGGGRAGKRQRSKAGAARWETDADVGADGVELL